MEVFKWEESYSVGIKSIDDQHKTLIDLINRFYENIKHKSSVNSIDELLRGIKKYAIYHFDHEEAMMLKHGYKGLVAHKMEHAKFANKVKEWESKYSEGKLRVSIELTDYLKKWLKEHILGTDMLYSGFLVSKGMV